MHPVLIRAELVEYAKSRVAASGQDGGWLFPELKPDRQAGVAEEVRDYLLGHTGGGTGRRYGTAHPASTHAQAIAGIQYT